MNGTILQGLPSFELFGPLGNPDLMRGGSGFIFLIRRERIAVTLLALAVKDAQRMRRRGADVSWRINKHRVGLDNRYKVHP